MMKKSESLSLHHLQSQEKFSITACRMKTHYTPPIGLESVPSSAIGIRHREVGGHANVTISHTMSHRPVSKSANGLLYSHQRFLDTEH